MPRGGELQLPTGSCSSPPPPEAGRYRPLGAVSTGHSIGGVGIGGLGAQQSQQRLASVSRASPILRRAQLRLSAGCDLLDLFSHPPRCS